MTCFSFCLDIPHASVKLSMSLHWTCVCTPLGSVQPLANTNCIGITTADNSPALTQQSHVVVVEREREGNEGRGRGEVNERGAEGGKTDREERGGISLSPSASLYRERGRERERRRITITIN